jgi:hypothetical protein
MRVTLLIAIVVTTATAVATLPPTCDAPTMSAAQTAAAEVKKMIRYANSTQRWYMEPKSPDDVREWVGSSSAQAAITDVLRDRHLLFIGDSTVRNAAISLAASLCNPHSEECAQLATWVPKDGVPDALTCGADKRPNTNSCARGLTVTVVPIVNLTSLRLPRSKMERKWMWKNGVLPPLVRVTLHDINATFDVIEAGCAGGGDGIWLVYRHLLRSAQYAENRSAAHVVFGDGDVTQRSWRDGTTGDTLFRPRQPPFARYDAVLTSAGLHCTYKHYRSGMWYRHLRRNWHLVTAFTPVVWFELSHCLKDNAGHFFVFQGKQRLNYKKLASCPFIDSHVDTINNLFVNVSGVFLSPTRFITKGLKKVVNASRPPSEGERRNSSCLFADYLHPSLSCYAALNRAHVEILRVALRWQDARRSQGCFSPAALRSIDVAANLVDVPINRSNPTGKKNAGGTPTRDNENADVGDAQAASDRDTPSSTVLLVALVVAGPLLLPAYRAWRRGAAT